MRKYVLFFVFLVTAVSAAVLFSEEAECTWCPTYPCYGSCGLDKCVCVTPPGEYTGQCYGIERAEEFEARGYKVGR